MNQSNLTKNSIIDAAANLLETIGIDLKKLLAKA